MTMTALLRSRIPRKGDVRFWRPTAPVRVGVEFNYLPFIERTYPALAERYGRLYRRNSAPGEYIAMVQRRVDELKRRYHLLDRPAPVKERAAPPLPLQMSLFGNEATVNRGPPSTKS